MSDKQGFMAQTHRQGLDATGSSPREAAEQPLSCPKRSRFWNFMVVVFTMASFLILVYFPPGHGSLSGPATAHLEGGHELSNDPQARQGYGSWNFIVAAFAMTFIITLTYLFPADGGSPAANAGNPAETQVESVDRLPGPAIGASTLEDGVRLSNSSRSRRVHKFVKLTITALSMASFLALPYSSSGHGFPANAPAVAQVNRLWAFIIAVFGMSYLLLLAYFPPGRPFNRSNFNPVGRFWNLMIAIFTTVCLLALAYFPPGHGSPANQVKSVNTTEVERVGRLPAMGWNTWNSFWCNIDETLVLEHANLMKTLGLADAGYNHVNIDDCYSEKRRDADGNIVASATKFPSGMKNLTDKIHEMGFKAGIYSDSGWFTCQMYPGSFQNEARDAKLFQDWGFDYLKYDNCAIPFDDVIKEGMVGKFQRMSDAIKELAKTSGKPPLQFSLCQWGWEQPWLWAREFGQSWRTTGDIEANWRSVANIINRNSFIAWASDFYGHNDLDMLEIGNGELTYEESKTHFTAWALMKSPLLIGTDLRRATNQTIEILTNREIIAINQDPVVGTSVSPFRWGTNPDWTFNNTHPAQYWSGESENGTVVMLINTLDEPQDMTFKLTESPWVRAGRQYSVRDLWAHTDNGTAVRNFTAKSVLPHGVVALLLKDAGDEPGGLYPPCVELEWCTHQNGTRYDQL